MLIVRIIILITLIGIFVQDIKYRAVYWVMFPILLILLLVYRILAYNSLTQTEEQAALCIAFLIVLLVITTIWFSLKAGKLVNITVELLGWGDILFLLSLTIYLSFLNFLFFYIVSSIAILVSWLIWQLVSTHKSKHIPLAGLQALGLFIVLSSDWWLFHINVTDNDWLLKLLIK